MSEHFWAKVDVRSDDECWLWQHRKDRDGYGIFRHDGKMRKAHRLCYEWQVETIQPGNVILHTCDVPGCVNPLHLRQGTQADNVRDMFQKGRNTVLQGEKHGMAKLTEQQVREIRQLYPSISGNKLAKKYNVSNVMIYDIIHRKNWRHI